MSGSAALPHVLDKATYRAEEPVLREALLDVQFALLERRSFPVLILLAGADGADKGEAIQKASGSRRRSCVRDRRILEATAVDQDQSRRCADGTPL